MWTEYKEEIQHYEERNLPCRSVGQAIAQAQNRHDGPTQTGAGNPRRDDRLSQTQTIGLFKQLFASWQVLHAGGDSRVRRGWSLVVSVGRVFAVREPGADRTAFRRTGPRRIRRRRTAKPPARRGQTVPSATGPARSTQAGKDRRPICLLDA